MKEAIKVWIRNEREIEEAIIKGEEVQVVESDFGANEFLIDFLKRVGLWDIITGMLIKMGKNNGYSGKIILGILILKELMAIRKIAGAGKIIKDGKLASDIGFNIERIKKAEKEGKGVIDGFNIERIKKAEKEGKGVIDLGTLRNHLKKIPRSESDKAFYKHLKLLRNKRWIRG